MNGILHETRSDSFRDSMHSTVDLSYSDGSSIVPYKN